MPVFNPLGRNNTKLYAKAQVWFIKNINVHLILDYQMRATIFKSDTGWF